MKFKEYFKNNSEAGIEISLRITYFSVIKVDINIYKKLKIMEPTRYQNIMRSAI